MRFEHIAPDFLHQVWPWVRTGLERIAAKGKEPWWPEDVYRLLGNKQASLHFGFAEDDNGEHRVGFFIAEPWKEPFSGELLLNIWCCYASGEDGGNFAEAIQFRDAAVAEFDRLATQVFHVKRIRLSGRRGWTKVLQGKFEPVRVTYERVLT